MNFLLVSHCPCFLCLMKSVQPSNVPRMTVKNRGRYFTNSPHEFVQIWLRQRVCTFYSVEERDSWGMSAKSLKRIINHYWIPARGYSDESTRTPSVRWNWTTLNRTFLSDQPLASRLMEKYPGLHFEGFMWLRWVIRDPCWFEWRRAMHYAIIWSTGPERMATIYTKSTP